jgi:FG-GAP repeat
MKYPASRVSLHLAAVVAFGILLVASAFSASAESKQPKSGSNGEEPFSKPHAVPKGISASDWAGIRAAHEAAMNDSRLTNNERRSRRALTADSIAQQAYLQASNLTVGGNFGVSVALSGDTVVVGSNGERTGENGQDAAFAGAAYVFVRNGSTWTQQAYLKAPKPKSLDSFGISVAISGDTIVVGAFGEDSDDVPEDEDNSGGAYVFVRNGTAWTQQAHLTATNPHILDNFGVSVAISGDTLVVGAYGESSSAGAAYVFVRSGSVWNEQGSLNASNSDTDDQFGFSVAISGDKIIVGAFGESSNANGVNGSQGDNSAPLAGAAYVFVRNGTAWSQQAYLKASNSDAGDFFGGSVALSGNTAVVGAGRESSDATGVDGDQENNNTASAGAAYVFTTNGTTWSQQAYLKASNTDAVDSFGSSVAVSGDTVIVGASLESSSATGVNGDESDNSAGGAGAAYVFVRNGVTWSQQAYLKASNTELQDRFGISAAIEGDTGVVGAELQPSQETRSGAAYVFTGLGETMPSIPLLNISTRMNVGTGDNVLIGGFIVVGTEPKKVLLRAIGPSLTAFGVLNALADPTIELHKPGNIVVTNDNWKSTQEQEIMDTGIPPTNDLESAILATLDPGLYTAIVQGKNNGTGVGLVEVYDLDEAADSELANISTRGFVDIDENVMIGGFIVGDGVSTSVVVRAIGPSLSAVGVSNPLENPTLELFDSGGTQLAFNDDWKDSQQTEIEDSGLGPGDDRESALAANLVPGAYTAIVRGKDNTSGVGLMEVYNR